jgi:hypothetical protein
MAKEEADNLMRVKLALARKYAHKARIANSKPRKAVLWRRAEHYLRQAEGARQK